MKIEIYLLFNKKKGNQTEMFSCFCAGKKRPSRQKTQMQPQIVMKDGLERQQKKQIQHQPIKSTNPNDNSSTMETPQPTQIKQYQLLNLKKISQKSNQTSLKMSKVKSITSINELHSSLQDQRPQILYQINSYQDSQTVPYKSKKQPSEVSTPKNSKQIQVQTEKKRFDRRQKQKQIDNKQSNKHQQEQQFVYSITPQQDELKRYFSLDQQIHNYHSKQAIKLQKNSKFKDFQRIPSIDYSRYSEIDKQVSSSEILDLDEQLESKLQQIQNNFSFYQQKTFSTSYENKIYQSRSKSDKNKVTDTSRFKKSKKSKKFNNIENDFEELEKAQQQIQNNLFHNAKLISKPNRQKVIRISNIQQQPFHEIGQTHQNQEQQNCNKISQTIKTELDNIICSQSYFSCIQTVRLPQNIQNFRKFLAIQEDNHEFMDETLEEAQNAFNCYSINEEFSRAVITQKLDLALRIFERMTLQQKNQKDIKGYVPVHLVILATILNQRYFQLAKKIMYHSDVRLDVQGPTGWSPLQQTISFKHIRLSPNIFVASHRKKLALIRKSLQESTKMLGQMEDFYFELDVKVDSFIPLLSSITPQDTIKITKIGSSLMIDYTLVGYEYLSCKRRDMSFLLNNQSIYALNRSKSTYCDLLQELDKEEIQLLVVESLQCETKKIQPQVNRIEMKEARSIFDNQIVNVINSYKAKKFTFAVDYTSKTQKRMPSKLQNNKQHSQGDYPLSYLKSWQDYLKFQPQINIKPKNKNKKIELQMWLSKQFSFKTQNLLKIFELFSLCNPVAKIISNFLSQNLKSIDILENQFPVKIDVPINFSLYFNLQFKALKFKQFQKDKLQIEENLKKISRKEFQNISESKEKRSFAISVFT